MPSLQRSLDTQPTIASVGETHVTPKDQSNLIQQAGGALRDFAVKRKEEKLQEDLNALGDEVVAAKQGQQLSEATDRFDRLAKAKKQGILTDDMVRIETEAILKSNIESMPAFAPELRRYAAERLGYDPTGEQLRQQLDIPGPAEEDPRIKKARSLAATGAGSFEDIYTLIGNAEVAQLRADRVTAQATIGAAGRREILSATLGESQGRFADALGDVLSMVQTGGVEAPAQVKSVVLNMAAQQKQALLARYQTAGITPDSTQISADMSAVDAMWGPLIQMANEGSLTEILENNSKAIAAGLTIEGYNLFGDLFVQNQIGGQEAVKNYFKYHELFKKPEELNLLRQVSPELGLLIDTIGDSRVLGAAAYKRVMGVDPLFLRPNGTPAPAGETPPIDPSLVDAAADAMMYKMATDSTLAPEVKERRAAYAQARAAGAKWKVLGMYMQKGTFESATDQEKQHVQATFQEEYEPLMARIAAELSDPSLKDVTIGLDRGGILTVQSPKVPTGNPFAPYKEQRVQVSNETLGDLKRLQAFEQGARNGWANTFGVNANSFMPETVTRINEMRQETKQNEAEVEAAIKALEEGGPTPENIERLRKVAPDILNRANEFVTTGGGTNNVNK